MLEAMRNELGYDSARGILDYGHQVGHWRFVGIGRTPFTEMDRLQHDQPDGVIGEFASLTAAMPMIEAGITAVNMTRAVDNVPLPAVWPDDEAIGRMGAEHLLERGFVNFAFFGSDDDGSSLPRMVGFSEVIRAAQHRCEQRIQPSAEVPNIYELIPGWLEELPKPVAIMAHQDYVARLTVDAAVEQGLTVPEDVAVLGVNNYRWNSILAAVPVSSIELDRYRMGRLAAETLDALMAGGTAPPPRLVPPVGAVTRRSTEIVLTEDPLVTQVVGYIRDHCQEGLAVDDLMDQVRVSRRNLEKRIKKATGLTPQAAIFRGQIEKAKHMLTHSHTAIEAISRACGFRQPARLNQVFKRMTGMTPGEFRRQRYTSESPPR
jgi:LacI family transcriptional regulator